jgi:hypothetical protein
VLIVAVSELRSRPSIPAGAGNKTNHTVMGLLGVLHQPETKADSRIASFEAKFSQLQNYFGVRPLLRYATTAPWGAEIFIVAPPIDGVPQSVFPSGSARPREHGPSQFVGEMAQVTPVPRAIVQFQALTPLTAANIERGAAIYDQGFYRGNPEVNPEWSHREDVVVIVPNGVTRVEFVLPRQPLPIVGAPIYPHVRFVTVAVHNNVAAAILDQPCCHLPGGALGQIELEERGKMWRSTPPPMIWLGAEGQVIKQIGDVAAAGTVAQLPTPAPETALSLAAERNPATPNPVWITPRVGYPDTTFDVHFHVLLNGAEYFYTLNREGTPLTSAAQAYCAPFKSYPGVSVGPYLGPLENLQVAAGLHPNDVRGDVWSDPLALDTQWPPPLCPGIYRLSVGVINRGISDPSDLPSAAKKGHVLEYPREPFGTVVFVVRPAPPSSHLRIYLLGALGAAVLGALLWWLRRRRPSAGKRDDGRAVG